MQRVVRWLGDLRVLTSVDLLLSSCCLLWSGSQTSWCRFPFRSTRGSSEPSGALTSTAFGFATAIERDRAAAVAAATAIERCSIASASAICSRSGDGTGVAPTPSPLSDAASAAGITSSISSAASGLFSELKER